MDLARLTPWLFELPQRILWAFIVIVGLTLWGPDRFVAGLGLQEFIDDYRKWIGVAFLVLVGIALSNAFEGVRGRVALWWLERKRLRDAKKRLHDLTGGEKEVLRRYISSNSRTQDLAINSGVTAGLVKASIIYQATEVSAFLMYFPHHIQPWAWEYLRAHPELLEPATDDV